MHLVPLDQEPRTAITTAEAAAHLLRKAQTLRGWAYSKKGPIQPVNVSGRLMWLVKDIQRVLRGE